MPATSFSPFSSFLIRETEKTHSLHSRARYCFVRVTLTTDDESARVRKPEKIFSTMCVYVRKPRLMATARRLKARRACLANISKTKYKLTRRPFGVYTTPRSRAGARGRGVEEPPREKWDSLGAIISMHFFIASRLHIAILPSRNVLAGYTRECSIQMKDYKDFNKSGSSL